MVTLSFTLPTNKSVFALKYTHFSTTVSQIQADVQQFEITRAQNHGSGAQLHTRVDEDTVCSHTDTASL